jgi:hypothetical protein
MRKISIVLITLFLLCGCSKLPDTYPFARKNLDITGVEVLCNDGYVGQNFRLIRTLEAEEIVDFMNALYELPTQKCITPPSMNFGKNVIKVIYENGDVEYFASWHIELVEKGAEIKGVGAYYFTEGFDELFEKYAYKETEDGSLS